MSSSSPLAVAVAGASGYAGGELLRLLSAHPEFEVTVVTAHSNAGQSLASVHPHLVSLGHLTLQETTADVLAAADVVFLALPHGASGALEFPDDVLVIDCGADHRLTSEEDWTDVLRRPSVSRGLDVRAAGIDSGCDGRQAARQPAGCDPRCNSRVQRHGDHPGAGARDRVPA